MGKSREKDLRNRSTPDSINVRTIPSWSKREMGFGPTVFRETSQMSKIHAAFAATATLSFAASLAHAEIYTDPVGDQGPGNANLDLTTIEVTNDDDYVYFAISTSEFAEWTKYMVFLDYADSGNSGFNNPWGRSVDMGANKIDAFAGIWVDNGGGSLTYSAGGGDWFESSFGTTVEFSGTTVSTRFSLNAMGIGVGDVIKFDIGTTGGGSADPATDLASVGSTSGSWGGSSSAGELRSYTVVPAPGALALMGLAGVFARRRRA